MLMTGLPLNEPSVFSVIPGDITTYGIGIRNAIASKTSSATVANDSVAVLRLMPTMMSPARSLVRGGLGDAGGPADGDPVRGIVGDARGRGPRRAPRQRSVEGAA